MSREMRIYFGRSVYGETASMGHIARKNALQHQNDPRIFVNFTVWHFTL